jgi:hypothetical protein
MNPQQPANTSMWHAADRVGAAASFLCAVHCAALPFVLALLPFVGLGFLADHRFERAFVLFACVLAAIALGRGYRRHRERLPLQLAAAGITLLVFGVLWMDDRTIAVHSALVSCGGVLLAGAHFVNLRIDRRGHAAHAHGAGCAL